MTANAIIRSLIIIAIVLIASSVHADAPLPTPEGVTVFIDDLDDLPVTTMLAADLVPPTDAFPSAWIGTSGKVLIADLSDFRLFAYEDGVLIRSSLVAIGRFNYATETGFFSVQRRATAADLTYRGVTVEDVPYILAYTDAFAIHGAYWHDASAFGTRASSGCLNLPVDEAAWYFDFAEIGTPVIIRA